MKKTAAPQLTGGPAMPTTDGLLSESHAGTAKALLRTSLASFNERGFHATTTRQISDAAGVSPGTIYVHFQNKQEILFTLCEIAHRSALRTVQERIRFAAHGEGGPVGELLDVVQAFTAWHGANPTLARVAQYEFTSLSDAHLATILTLRRETESAIRDSVSRAVDHLALPSQRKYGIGTVILSLGVDVSRWFQPDGRMSPADVGDLYADCIARMLRT